MKIRISNANEMAIALKNSERQASNVHQQTAVKAHTWDARAEKLATWLDAL